MEQLLNSLQDTLQSTAFVTFVRESNSVLAYPTILAFHTFGMAFLVGLSVAISLRILGIFPSLPLAPLARLFPLIWLGFWVNAVSGLVLLSLTPADFLTMPVFYIKLAAIAGAVISIRSLRVSVFGDRAGLHARTEPVNGKIFARTTLTLWLVAISAGRLTAYSFDIQWRSAIAILVLAVLLFAGYRATRRVPPSGKVARQAARPASSGY